VTRHPSPLPAPISGSEWKGKGLVRVSTRTGERWTYHKNGWQWSCTDEQWGRVLDAVSPLLLAGMTPAALSIVRDQYTKAASDYLALIYYHNKRFAKGSSRKLWQSRQTLLTKFAPRDDEPATARYRDLLIELKREIDVHVLSFEMQGQAHWGNEPERDKLYYDLLKIWRAHFAGELTTAKPHDKAKSGKRSADSPAIRYLVAALEPILRKTISPNTAANVIAAEKRRLKLAPVTTEKLMAFLTSPAMTTPRG
jgi:hypothetical protein